MAAARVRSESLTGVLEPLNFCLARLGPSSLSITHKVHMLHPHESHPESYFPSPDRKPYRPVLPAPQRRTRHTRARWHAPPSPLPALDAMATVLRRESDFPLDLGVMACHFRSPSLSLSLSASTLDGKLFCSGSGRGFRGEHGIDPLRIPATSCCWAFLGKMLSARAGILYQS